MTQLHVADLRPLQAMAASMFFQKRRLLLSLPRQFGGKTELGVRLTHDFLMQSGKQSIFLAKDKKSAKRAVREKHVRIFDPEVFKVNTELVQHRANPGSVCFVESVDKDPDRIRGGTFGLVHWSEVAFSKIEHGHSIIDVFDKVVQPALRLADGYVLMESTNNGFNGWHELWNRAEEFKFARLLISFSSMVEMGMVPRHIYDDIKATTHPDVFRQEYECEWVTFEGKIYNEFNANNHIKHDMPFPEDWQTVVCGIDWGYNDATCFLFAYVKDGKVNIFDEIYEKEKTLDDIWNIFTQHKGVLWNCGNFAAAADHDKARNEELNRRGIPCAPAKKADTLGNRLQVKEKFYKDEIYIHPRCKMLIKDLGAATWDAKKTNDIDEKQCTWGHFDAEAALRYLIRELSEFEEEEPEFNPHEMGDNLSNTAWKLRAARSGVLQ